MRTIYALRERNSIEVRYIGQSTKDVDTIRARHVADAKSHACGSPRTDWVIAVGERLEVVPLIFVGTREAANQSEREFASLFSRLGHRLFNIWLVPTEHRIANQRARRARIEAARQPTITDKAA